nr:MAG TPA: hypothetical protein [Caudoviricetes sp.]
MSPRTVLQCKNQQKEVGPIFIFSEMDKTPEKHSIEI